MRGFSVGENSRNRSRSQKPRNVIRVDIPNGAVGAALDVTGRDHIPQRKPVRDQKVSLFANTLRDRRVEHSRRNPPKAVLRMPVKERGLSRFDRRETPENQSMGMLVPHGRNRMNRHGAPPILNGSSLSLYRI